MLSKHVYIFYVLHVRKWNTGRRNVVCGDKEKVLVTYGNRNQSYIWPDITVCWKKMTPSFVCAVFLVKAEALLLFKISIFRVCNCPQWLQLTDPEYCSPWSFVFAMILWLNLLSCASFRYIFCFFRFSVLETDIVWMKIGRKTWKASGFWVRWQNIREASGTPQMVGINCCGRAALPGTPWSLFLK